jgi:hypothetical protein
MKMRTTALTFLIMIQSLLMNAQFNTMFNDTINNFENLHNEFDVICKDDSFFYILGATYNFDFTWNTNISKFNEDGDKLLSNYIYDTFTNTASNPYNSMVINNDVILACFQTYDTITFGKIIAFDKHSLDTLWSKTYAHPDTLAASQFGADVFSDLTSIKPIPGGGYIVTGNYNKNCITGNMRSFLMKIDSLGNVLWRKTYDDIRYIFDLELTNDGYVVLYKYYHAFFVRIDNNGNIIWQKQINSNMPYGQTAEISKHNGSNYIGMIQFVKNNDPNNYLCGLNVFEIDINNQQVLWDKTFTPYYSTECLSLHQAMGVEALPNGDIIVSGTAKNNGYAGFILKLNTNGDSLWCKSYSYGPSGNRNCQLNDLLLCDDGGFMGVGYYAPHNSNMTAWMFKTDANGVVGWESHEGRSNKAEVKICPNPSTDDLNISLLDQTKKIKLVRIFDTQQREIFSKQVDSQQTKVDVSNYDSGLYLVEGVLESGERFVGKFVKE